MNKWLQIVAGFATAFAAHVVWLVIAANADLRQEGVLLMAMVGFISLIVLTMIVHHLVGWRHYWIGVTGVLGMALLLIGGCFVVFEFG